MPASSPDLGASSHEDWAGQVLVAASHLLKKAGKRMLQQSSSLWNAIHSVTVGEVKVSAEESVSIPPPLADSSFLL